ncbi:MAG: sulfate/molybdate ABC transporter ATP-binding protein [Reyranella sp.]|nr:sulfate/molybdate ABC transporter ATP-binding protein [Reyranella sp.]MBL6650118.1 sulfate/molybdate ABC transporter ATP-binding protein [Reyranella sp.]
MAIRVEGLTKSFDITAAVDGIDLDVRPGELLALLGPSGSGKTTLLRLVAGLETPTAGRILFGGEDATRLAVRDRRVGFVFQHYALFRHLNVAENIAYGLRVRPRRTRPSNKEIKRRVAELLDLVQLHGLDKRHPAQLSGGQRQRVALARALAVEPRVLLLDEPFGALDAKVRRDLRRWLREVHDRTGHTTLFVTHDQEEALELADRVAIFNRGRIEQVGTADDVLDRPATSFVAGFVAESVRLPVDAAGSWIRIGPHQVRTPEENVAGPAELFVRPNDLVITENDPDAIRARVLGVRRSGSSRRAELSLADGLPAVEIELPEGRAARRGDVVPVVLTHLRLFTR